MTTSDFNFVNEGQNSFDNLRKDTGDRQQSAQSAGEGEKKRKAR